MIQACSLNILTMKILLDMCSSRTFIVSMFGVKHITYYSSLILESHMQEDLRIIYFIIQMPPNYLACLLKIKVRLSLDFLSSFIDLFDFFLTQIPHSSGHCSFIEILTIKSIHHFLLVSSQKSLSQSKVILLFTQFYFTVWLSAFTLNSKLFLLNC